MQELTHHLAQTLRALRRQRGWSLDKTAAMTGVSKAMLGQIERGESSPTIGTLWKIATGFQVSFSVFLGAQAMESGLARRPPLGPPEAGILISPLFVFDPRFGFEWLDIELLPGCEHLSEPHLPGVTEHVVVLDGEMEVLLGGEWCRLGVGETLRFAADQPHGYRNAGSGKVRFHNLIHYPANVPLP